MRASALFLVFAAICASCSQSSPIPTTPPTMATSPTTADAVVRPWLEAMRKGGDGFEYWRKGDPRGLPPRTAFYAVTDYTIVDDAHGRYTVRIHSSTRGGSPIVKVYEVVATDSGIYRVTAQGDDPLAWVEQH